MIRVKAFTLLEVVLSLFIVALLGVFAFYILQNVQGGLRAVGSSSSEQQELLFLSSALRTDLERARSVQSNDQGVLECRLDSGTVRYEANGSGITRTLANGNLAVFHLPVKNATATLLRNDLPLVALWRITFESGNLGMAAFRKTYAPVDLIREHNRNGDPDPQ